MTIPLWPDWLAGKSPEDRADEIVRAVAAQYCHDDGVAHWLYISQARELLLRLLDEAGRTWRRGADGRWPDGHKCGGCRGPESEECDCCAGACECRPVPDAWLMENAPGIAQLNLATAALAQIADPVWHGDRHAGGGDPISKQAYAAQVLEAMDALGEATSATGEVRAEVPRFLAVNRVDRARHAVLQAALHCLSLDASAEASPHADDDASAEHAADQLALVARELAAATDALPDGRPVGWERDFLDRQAAAEPELPAQAEVQRLVDHIELHRVINAAAARFAGQAAEPEPGPPLPPGYFARVELPGWRDYTGWFTEGSLGGEPVVVISDWDGREVASFKPGPNALVVRLPTPQRRPDPPRVITATVAPQPFGSGFGDDIDGPWHSAPEDADEHPEDDWREPPF